MPRIRCFQSMGINIEETDHTITVHGKGLHGLSAPLNILDVGNSGTTTRLLSGILAGQKFESKHFGRRVFKLPPYETDHRTAYNDGRKYFKYSQKRMRSAVHRSGKLHGTTTIPPSLPHQVKSCILLAGLYAEGETSVTEPSLSRNTLN